MPIEYDDDLLDIAPPLHRSKGDAPVKPKRHGARKPGSIKTSRTIRRRKAKGRPLINVRQYAFLSDGLGWSRAQIYSLQSSEIASVIEGRIAPHVWFGDKP